jgi:hypothetical protein
LDIRLCEELEFLSYEFDAFSMGAIHKHHIGLDFLFIGFVDFHDKVIHDGSLSTARCSMKNDMWDFIRFMEIVEFLVDFFVGG